MHVVLWKASDDLCSVVAAYDERRFHLHLLRPHGTVKAAVFDDYQTAVAAANKWREEVLAQSSQFVR